MERAAFERAAAGLSMKSEWRAPLLQGKGRGAPSIGGVNADQAESVVEFADLRAWMECRRFPRRSSTVATSAAMRLANTVSTLRSVKC